MIHVSIKEFLVKMVSSSSDINSKIIGGFLSLIFTIVFGFFRYTEPMIVMAGLTAGFFGLSSLDYKALLLRRDTKDIIQHVEQIKITGEEK